MTHVQYAVLILFIIEQVLYYLDFYYAYKYGISIKTFKTAKVYEPDRIDTKKHLKYTNKKDLTLIRFTMHPWPAMVPLPFVYVVDNTTNDKFTVKVGIGTIALAIFYMFDALQ